MGGESSATAVPEAEPGPEPSTETSSSLAEESGPVEESGPAEESSQAEESGPAEESSQAQSSEAQESSQAQESSRAKAPAEAGALFPRVGRWSRGYEVAEVDRFFAVARTAYEGPLEAAMSGSDVRRTAFDLVRGGYDPSAVDAALDRLEGAFVRRQRAAFVADKSQQEWMAQVAERATTLYPRLVRPVGRRFAPPRRGHGYAAVEVDAILERLVEYFDRGGSLTSTELRAATFGSARGRRAYAEGPVDAFLDRAVEVLLAVE